MDQSIYDVSSASPLVALLAFLALIWRRRSRIAAACGDRPAIGSGAGLLVAGFLLVLWWRQFEATRLAIPAFVLESAGAALLLGGARLLRILGLPFGVLLFGAPLPPELVNQLVFPMQLAAVSLSSSMLDLLGFAHEVRGDLISKDGTVFQVIEGCSGLKSTLSLMLASLVYADFVDARPRVRPWLFLLAVPIGVLLNGIRVTLLVVGNIGPDSFEHFALGILTIVSGVFVIAAIELSTSRSRAEQVPDEPAESRRAELESGRIDRTTRILPPRAVAAVVVAATALVEVVPISTWPSVSPAVNIETLPQTILGRSAREQRGDDAFLGSVWFQHRIHRTYESAERGRPTIRVFIGHEDIDRGDRSGYSPKTVVPASGWQSRRRIRTSPEDRTQGRIDPEGSERWIFDYPGRRTLVLHWRMGYAPWGTETLARYLLLNRSGLSAARRSPLVIRVECDGRATDDLQTWMILRQVAGEIEDWYAGARASNGRR